MAQTEDVCRASCERRRAAGGADVVGVDVSGRHAEAGEYLMVAAAVHAEVGTTRLHSIEGTGFATSTAEPTLPAVTAVVVEAIEELPEPPGGPVVAEHGEFYEEPAWQVAHHVERDFKYVESIAGRETVQAAHHAAYGARQLVL